VGARSDSGRPLPTSNAGATALTAGTETDDDGAGIA